jgi:hypothetical protein
MTSGGYQWCYLTTPGFSLPPNAINIIITVHIRAKKTGMNVSKISGGVSDGIYPTLAVAAGPVQNVPSTLWSDFTFTLPQNEIGPFQDWTPDAVNAINAITIRQEANTAGTGFTQVYAEVSFDYAPPTPYPCQLPSVAGVHPLYHGRYRTQTDDVNWAQVWATVTPWLTYDEFIQQVNTQYDRLEVVEDLNATTEDLITARAQAMLTRPQRFRAEGEALIPAHCGLDLWDRVQLVDARVSLDKVFRAIGCLFTWAPKSKSYQMELKLGPDETVFPEQEDMPE